MIILVTIIEISNFHTELWLVSSGNINKQLWMWIVYILSKNKLGYLVKHFSRTDIKYLLIYGENSNIFTAKLESTWHRPSSLFCVDFIKKR